MSARCAFCDATVDLCCKFVRCAFGQVVADEEVDERVLGTSGAGQYVAVR